MNGSVTVLALNSFYVGMPFVVADSYCKFGASKLFFSSCNFRARLRSDPSSVVSVSGCSSEDLAAVVVTGTKPSIADKTYYR